MNERRFVLVLPVIVVWYVLGVKQAILALTWARDRLSRRSRAVGRGTATTVGRLVGAGAAMVLVGAPLVAQFPRDYLFKFGQDSSTPHGSPYMNLLHQLGGSRDVVETTYLWTTALLTGHRTASAVYRAPCDDPSVRGAVVVDRASYMLDAALNKPGQVESGCLLQVATASTWVIPLLHTSRDEASVFELIGPGTAHPDRVDLVSGQPVIDSSYLRWTWSRPVGVKQVTLGSGAGRVHPERGLTIELRLFNGDWVTVASSPGRVGDGARTRFLAVELPEMLVVTEVRITAGGEPPALKDFHVLGSNSP